ncbi:MAG: ATP-binding protein [Clostridiales bacterium]|nr:ATP-binding protein [Clostridiales bacterium]
MSKIIAICGKICSGKTYYANQIKQKENAVVLSCDELTKELFNNDLGDKHDEMAIKIQNFLMKKSIELINIGCNVILDWGFWSREEREKTTIYYKEKNINIEWHYIDADLETWKHNIEERNQRILNGEGGSDFYLDEGLMNKLISKWEEPDKSEIDIWYELKI